MFHEEASGGAGEPVVFGLEGELGEGFGGFVGEVEGGFGEGKCGFAVGVLMADRSVRAPVGDAV